MRSSTHSQDDAGAAARSSAAMNSRLSSRARDPGGLGPKPTRRFRSAKARFASNSPPEAKVGVFGVPELQVSYEAKIGSGDDDCLALALITGKVKRGIENALESGDKALVVSAV